MADVTQPQGGVGEGSVDKPQEDPFYGEVDEILGYGSGDMIKRLEDYFLRQKEKERRRKSIVDFLKVCNTIPYKGI